MTRATCSRKKAGATERHKWTAVGTRVDCDATATVGRTIRRGSETPRNKIVRSLVQWAKEVHQLVVNDRAGKRGIKC